MGLGSLRRWVAVAVASGATVMLTAPPASAMTTEEQTFLKATNAVRAYWHERPLADNLVLDAKAEVWAQVIAANHALFHSNLAAGLGTLPWIKLGENVGAQPQPCANPDQAIADAFVRSSNHFWYLIDPAFSQMGVGVARSLDGTLWVVEEFAQLAT